MDRILELLERKNLCYRNFHRLCNDYIDEITLGSTEGLDGFLKKRQSLLDVLEQIEGEINKEIEVLRATRGELEAIVSPAQRDRIKTLWDEKDSHLKNIMALDKRILLQVERFKDDALQKLQSIQIGRKTLGSYKSPMSRVEQAEDIKIVDHEA